MQNSLTFDRLPSPRRTTILWGWAFTAVGDHLPASSILTRSSSDTGLSLYLLTVTLSLEMSM